MSDQDPLAAIRAKRRGDMVRLMLLRVFSLAGLVASGLALAEALRPGRGYCPFEENCARARESALGSLFGVPTSGVGVAAFAAIYVLTFLPVRTARLPLRAGGLVAALAGATFLAYQAFVLMSFCPLCVVADVSGIALGLTVLGWRRAGFSGPGGGGIGRLAWAAAPLVALAAILLHSPEPAPSWVPRPASAAPPFDFAAADPAPEESVDVDEAAAPPSTTPETEGPTEPSGDAPTGVSAEPPTQSPTEPSTEPLTGPAASPGPTSTSGTPSERAAEVPASTSGTPVPPPAEAPAPSAAPARTEPAPAPSVAEEPALPPWTFLEKDAPEPVRPPAPMAGPSAETRVEPLSTPPAAPAPVVEAPPVPEPVRPPAPTVAPEATPPAGSGEAAVPTSTPATSESAMASTSPSSTTETSAPAPESATTTPPASTAPAATEPAAAPAEARKPAPPVEEPPLAPKPEVAKPAPPAPSGSSGTSGSSGSKKSDPAPARPKAPAVAKKPPPPPRPLVEMVEFINPFCPHCRATHVRLERLLPTYGTKVRCHRVRVWATDPTPLWAQAWACADAAGKGDAFFEALLRTDGDTPQSVWNAAHAVGLDPATLSTAVRRGDGAARAAEERRRALASQLRMLPTLDVGSRRLQGEQSEGELRSAIDAAIRACLPGGG